MELIALLVSNIPALICLMLGLILVIVEMLLPGFGVPGLSGIILLAAGIIASGGTLVQMLTLAAVAVVLLLIAFPLCMRVIAKGKLEKSPISLRAVSLSGKKDDEKINLVGKQGIAQTALRPAGIVLVDGEKLNVVAAGEFIPSGAKVQVERVEGNRIVVSLCPQK